MTLLRSIIALVGGFAIMAFLILILDAFAAFIFPAKIGAPSMQFLFANLVLTACAAAAGGYAASSLAPSRARAHALLLAVMILAMSASQLGHPRPGEPTWYPLAITVIGPVFAVVGGVLRSLSRPQEPRQVTS